MQLVFQPRCITKPNHSKKETRLMWRTLSLWAQGSGCLLGRDGGAWTAVRAHRGTGQPEIGKSRIYILIYQNKTSVLNQY